MRRRRPDLDAELAPHRRFLDALATATTLSTGTRGPRGTFRPFYAPQERSRSTLRARPSGTVRVIRPD